MMSEKLVEKFIIVLYSNGAISCLITAFIVVTIVGANRKANKYFSFLLVALSLSYLYVLFLSGEIIRTIPYIFCGMHKAAFIFGPALYFYFMTITRRRFTFKYSMVSHFIPFITYSAAMMPVYLSSDAEKIDIYKKYTPYFMSVFFVIFIHFNSYMLYTYFFIKRNGIIILKKFKGVEDVAINWFRYLSLLSMGLGFTCLVLSLLHIILDISPLIMNILADLIIVISVNILAYKGVRRIEILQYVPETTGSKKYMKSGMNRLQAENYMDAVVQYIQKDKKFINSELNLKLLSQELSISEHHLSQIFSQFMQITFNDYVNSLRIEEAKRLIYSLPADYPIIRIAFDVGFNSKSSFNSNFKKFSKITPTEFKSGKNNIST